MLIENSTEAIRDGLLKVLADEELYEQMKTVARENTERFDINEQIRQAEDLFDEPIIKS